MRYLLLVNGQMPVELKTGELAYEKLDDGRVPEPTPAAVKSWFEGIAAEKTFLAILRGVWGALTIDSWQHSACQPGASDQSGAESIRSRPSSEDTLNVLTLRASTLASETQAPLILGEGTGPGGAHQLGIVVAANVPQAKAASVIQEYWRTVAPPFRTRRGRTL